MWVRDRRSWREGARWGVTRIAPKSLLIRSSKITVPAVSRQRRRDCFPRNPWDQKALWQLGSFFFFCCCWFYLVKLLKMWLCLSSAGWSRIKKAMSILDAFSSQRPGLTWEAETKWKNLYPGGRLQKQKLKPIWTILFSCSRLPSAPSPRRICFREPSSISTKSFPFLVLPETWDGATWG